MKQMTVIYCLKAVSCIVRCVCVTDPVSGLGMCFFVCLKKNLRMYLWWSLCTLYVYARMSGETNRRRLGSLLLYLCYVVRALINSLVC